MNRRFELTDGSSAKFWEVSVAEGTLTVKFGKLGTTGQTTVKQLGEKANAEASKLIAEKTKKGYREVGGAPLPSATTAAPEPSPSDTIPGDEELPAELALFRAAKKGFWESPDFGELRFLKAKDVPAMRAHDPSAPMWDRATWIAEEADGACLGYLHVPQLALTESPVVLLDNEGSLHVTGATLVDHFGSWPHAAHEDDEAIEPLRKFCEKHGLPKWRGPKVTKAIEEALGLAWIDVTQPVAIDIAKWREQVTTTQPGPATRPQKPKAPAAKKGLLRPLSDMDVFVGRDRHGAVVFGVSGSKSSSLLRWDDTAERFETVAKVPGWSKSWAYDGDRWIAMALGPQAYWIVEGGKATEHAFPGADAYALSLLSSPAGAPVGVHRDGRVYRLEGDGFVPVAIPRPRASPAVARGADGTVFYIGGRDAGSQVVVESYAIGGDDVRAIAPYPAHSVWDAPVVALTIGDRLVCAGETIVAFDRAANAWGPASEPLMRADSYAALDERTVVILRHGDAAVYTYDLEERAFAIAGKLALLATRSSSAIAGRPGRLLVGGGSLGISRNGKGAAEFQIWERPHGTARALAGCEEELAAQAVAQPPKFHPKPYTPLVASWARD